MRIVNSSICLKMTIIFFKNIPQRIDLFAKSIGPKTEILIFVLFLFQQDLNIKVR